MTLKSGNLIANKLPKPLTTIAIIVRTVDIFAHKDNKNDIYLGGFETSGEENNEKGYVLSPGDVFSITSEDDEDDKIDLSEIFIAARNPSDYVTWGASLSTPDSN
jgi:hypothetical protein